MLRVIIIILQKLCRSGIQIPLLGRVGWKIAKALRLFFGTSREIGPLQTTYDRDIRMWVSLSDHIEAQIFWQGVQEADRGEVALLKSILRPDHVFFDVGANVGVFTLLAAKRLRDGCVHAFEPSSMHLFKMHNNIKLNGFRNIVVNPIALSNTASHRTLYFPKGTGLLQNTGMATLFEGLFTDYTAEHVQANRLDDYVIEQILTRVDVLKIDVEGSELDVLIGGVRTLDRFKPVIVMEVNQKHVTAAGRSIEEIVAFWHRIHYKIYRIKLDGSLCALSDASRFGDHQNIFCCPGTYSRKNNL